MGIHIELESKSGKARDTNAIQLVENLNKSILGCFKVRISSEIMIRMDD